MSVTPDFIGQIYKDTTTGNLWRANSLTAGDWTLELQNSHFKWTPRNLNFPGLTMIEFYAGGSGMTGMSSDGTLMNNVDIEDENSLVSILFPNLATITKGLILKNNTGLTAIDFSSLAQVSSGDVEIIGNDSLTTVSFPSLVSVIAVAPASAGFDIEGAAITSVSIPLYVPLNGSYFYSASPLDAVSVNHILSRYVANAAYVSGSIDMKDGGEAAPTGQGILDKATLAGRGVTVLTN